MKANGKNIIFDDDVTMTGQHIGESLSDVVGGLETKYKKLESQIKWIYNYGGVGGSGSGSGGGSGDYSINATLNNLTISGGKTISLGGTRQYPLVIKINKPGLATYTAVYKIMVEGTLMETSSKISLNSDNNYTFEKNILLSGNGQIVIEVTDSLYNETTIVEANYITELYNIDIALVNRAGQSVLGSQGEVLINEVNKTTGNDGLCITIDYKVAVKFVSMKYELTFRTPKATYTTTQEIVDRSGSITIDITKLGREEWGWNCEDSDAGFYTVTTTVNLDIENNSIDPTKQVTSFNLIPSSLYLLVSPNTSGASIYTSNRKDSKGNEIEPDITGQYEFKTGITGFYFVPYYKSSTNTARVSYKLGGTDGNYISREVNLQSIWSVEVNVTTSGWKSLVCKVEYSGETFEIIYWFYVTEDESSLSWFNIGTRTRTGMFNYVRGGAELTTDSSNSEGMNLRLGKFRKLTNGGISYKHGVNDSPLSIAAGETDDLIKTPNVSDTEAGTYNTIINIGLQYSDVNSDSSVIFKGYILDQSDISTNKKEIPAITVYQNKIVLSDDSECNFFYFPKTDHDYGNISQYHLLTLVSRFINIKGFNKFFEVTAYIDGRLEGAFKSYYTQDMLFSHIELGEKANITYNLLDISYVKPLVSNGAYETEDYTAANYYLKYVKTRGESAGILHSDTLLEFSNLIRDCASNFTIDNNTGDVTCSHETIGTLSSKMSVPTLVMTVNDNGRDLKTNYFDHRAVNQEEKWDPLTVGLEWAPARGELVSITVPSGNSEFRISPQGSSTKGYKCKNFNLLLASTLNNPDTVWLFSPNFKEGDTTTFLPEQQFTLKADVVDSSHSNNTSIGKFVNKVCDKFNTGEKGALDEYVKNCLDGFPVMVYLQIIKPDPNDPNKTISTCYLQGVYNFNLGRESFYNLGYKSSNNFCSNGVSNLSSVNPEKGFLFYEVNSDNDKFKNGLAVAEIQDNSTFFDFSQSDSKILFGAETDESGNVRGKTMFGDFVSGGNINSTIEENILMNLVESISKAGGYIFESVLHKNISNSPDNNYGYADGYSSTKKITKDGITTEVPANLVPNYRVKFTQQLDDTGNYVYITDGVIGKQAESTDVNKLIIDDENDAGQIPWINLNSVVEYYTICMAFGLVDSVQKNMNLKSWNCDPNKTQGTFYTAFYDMDTCLGVDNAGNDVSYFAFSDYWARTYSGTGEVITPSGVTIYRDYSPSKEVKGDNDTNDPDADVIFYDIPSSYLFAVAKYAKMIYGDGYESSYAFKWPNSLWALWRSGNTEDTDTNERGILSSAEKFVANFFSNNLGSICPYLVSLNYRNKYFTKGNEADTTFNETDFNKFNGTRINKVEDWLTDRFHILDAYFNLPGSTSPVQYYNENDEYIAYKNDGKTLLEPTVNSSTYNLASNSDVIVLQDIFSSGDSRNQTNTTLNINIKAKQYSPLFIGITDTMTRYLLGDDTATYHIRQVMSGNQAYSFYGSGAWTYLDSLNTFAFNKLFVNSKYLESLSATNSSATMEINSDNITVPSLRTFTASGSGYSGIFCNYLTSDTNKTDRFSNLNLLNLSNSKLRLELDSSNIANINLEKINSNSINILNCESLSDITFGTGDSNTPSLTVGSMSISPVPESQTNSSKGIVLSYSKITNLTMKNNSSKGISKFKITNDTALEYLTLSGFAYVHIEGCTNLKAITITDPADGETTGDKLIDLYIDNCGSETDTGIKLGTAEESKLVDHIIDLTSFDKLSDLRISNCKLITAVNTSQNAVVRLRSYGLASNSSMLYFDAANVQITGSNTFRNSNSYTLKRSENGSFLTPTITTTDLSYTFFMDSGKSGSITKEAIKWFIEKSSGIDKVTNINDMLVRQSSIVYSESDLQEDLRNSSSKRYIDMSNFKNVTSATEVFYDTGVTALHVKMFNIGSNVSSISANNYFVRNNGSAITAAMINYMSPIIEKMESGVFGQNPWNMNALVLKLYSKDSNNFLSEVNLKDLFHPTDVNGVVRHPKNITSLKYIELSREHTKIHMYQSFENWSSLSSITCFLRYSGQYDSKLYELEGLFKYKRDSSKNLIAEEISLPNLSSINLSFGLSKNTPINMYSFINWETFIGTNKSGDMFSTVGWGNRENYQTNNFSINRYIKIEDFVNIWTYLSKSSRTALTSLFYNTTILLGDSEPILTIDNYANSKLKNIKSLTATFKNLKMMHGDTYDSNNEIVSMEIDGPNIFKQLSGVTTCNHTFSGTFIGKPLSFDFFNKRQVTKNSSAFYISDQDLATLIDVKNLKAGSTKIQITDENIDKFKQVHYYYYSYLTTFTEMMSIFRDVKWDNDARCFDIESVIDSFGDYIPGKNRLEDPDSGDIVGTSGTKYFIKTSEFTGEFDDSGNRISIDYFKYVGTVPTTTEIEDIENRGCGDYTKSFTSNNKQFTNFNISKKIIRDGEEVDMDNEDIVRQLFIAPDIFYACTSNCNINRAFYWSLDELDYDLFGMIPQNLLKNCKGADITYMMYNLNIIPRYFETITQDTIKEDRYCYVPHNFTTSTTLIGAFRFHLILPNRSKMSNGKEERTKYYVLFEDSISSGVTTLQNAFPNSEQSSTNGLRSDTSNMTASTDTSDYGIYYNIMYKNKNSEGIDLSVFRQLTVDGIVGNLLAMFLRGNLFASTTYLSGLSWAKTSSQNYTDYTITANIDTSGRRYLISQFMYLPNATGSPISAGNTIPLINFSGSSIFSIKKSQIIGSDSSENAWKPYTGLNNGNTNNIKVS